MGNSGATEKRPKFHGSLSDGVTEVPLMFVNAGGKDNPLAIRRSAYPRTSTRIAQGDTRYGDFELPYKPIEQANWTGGRGLDDFEKDTARYLDGGSVNPEHENQVILGGQPTYGTYTDDYTGNMQLPGNVTWQGLYSTQLYVSRSFTITRALAAPFVVANCELWIRKVGAPVTNLNVAIYTDSGGSPSTSHVAFAAITPASVTDVLSAFTRFAGAGTLVSGTLYHVVVYSSGTPDANNCWQVATDAGASGKKSANGSSWSAATFGPYFRFTETADCTQMLFEYKRATYAILNPSNGLASSLYINGDRGAADANTGHLELVNDATKAWTVNEWAGCHVLIIAGPGSGEKQPWRTIVSNTATALTVSTNWLIEHTTSTEYVILGSNKWSVISASLGALATDVAVAGDAFIVAFGSAVVARLMRHYNLGGVWTFDNSNAQLYGADKLAVTRTPEQAIVWGSINDHARYGTCVTKAYLPRFTDDSCRNAAGAFYLYTPIGLVSAADEAWDEYPGKVAPIIDGKAVRIAATGTGIMATRRLNPPMDITGAQYMIVPIRSSVNTAAPDMELCWDSTEYCGKSDIATFLQHLKKGITPTAVLARTYMAPSSVFSYDNSATNKWFELDNLIDGATSTRNPVLLEGGADYLYIGNDNRYSQIYFDVGVANTTAAVMVAEFWNGVAWTAITITDGTATAGPPVKSLAQDGAVTWTASSHWSRGCDATAATYLDTSLFWMRLSMTSAGTTDGNVVDITVTSYADSPTVSEARHYEEIFLLDENPNSGSDFTLYANSKLYIGFPKYGATGVYLDLSTVNNNAATMAAYYWNGTSYTSLSPTDGTASGGATLAVDGLISWTAPANWEPGTSVVEGQHLDQSLYWIYLKPSADLDPVAIVTMWGLGTDIDEAVDMPKVHDGDTTTYEYMTFRNTDRLVIMSSAQFTGVVVGMGITVNDVTATMAAQYWNGYVWTTLTITSDGTVTSGKTLAKGGTIVFAAPVDWQPMTLGEFSGYAIRLYPSADLTQTAAGATQHLMVTEIYVTRLTRTEVAIPALTANRWAYVQLPIASPTLVAPDPFLRAIVSIGLIRNTDLGAQNVDIGDIEATLPFPQYIPVGDASDPIRGMERYGDTETLWILKESTIWEMQDAGPVSVPLRELSGMRAYVSGRAHTVNDVYLYFGLDGHLQRYHSQALDDIGPDRDEGLPADRQGLPWTMDSHPGRVLLAINAGAAGFSSVLSRRSGGWHEIYRAPLGDTIHSMIVQVTEGGINRLWMAVGTSLLWIPLPKQSFNPLRDSNYRYMHEGYLVTGWISVGFLDIVKLWKSVKLFTENLAATKTIRVQYQLETGSLGTGWTDIVSVHNSSPFQEILLNAAYTVTGRRIRFRLIFATNDNTVTPVLKAFVLETLLRFPVKYQYSMTVRLADANAYVDDIVDPDLRAETHFTTIENWANFPTALTFRCSYSPYDNKLVVVEPPGARPLYIDPANQLEQHIVEITLLEI